MLGVANFLTDRSVNDPTTRTTRPIVTGATVLGIKYADGVMMVSDTLASYGSLARYKNINRMLKVGDHTIVGASGEMSDFQWISNKLEEMHQGDLNADDGYHRKPKEVHNYLRAIMYQRRGKGNPLWNQLLVAGYNKGPFLGYVDLIGTAYEENFIATGFGAYLALPIIRERWQPDLDEGEARALLEDCMRVLFYRDCRSSARIQLSKATAEGTLVSDQYVLSTEWETATFDARHNMPVDGSSW